MPDAYPHLKHAPITEALLDVRVQLPGALAPDALEAFRERVKPMFPEERPIKRLHTQVSFGEGGAGVTAAEQESIGSIFWSSTQKRAVQARIDGFSVNHVGDYEDWSALRDDAERYWREYLAAVRPLRVIRCAARFINRLELPAEDDLQKHLLTRPEIGDKLPQLMEEYFMRLVVQFPGERHAAITQATIPAEDGTAPRRRSLVLDIDTFVDVDLAPESPALWAELDELRSVKNACFFGSLQPNTWKAYQ